MDDYQQPDAEETIDIWREENWWLIRHNEIGITTQGKTRLHAILMLADAIAAYNDSDENLVELSKDVFIPDEEMIQCMEEFSELQDESITELRETSESQNKN